MGIVNLVLRRVWTGQFSAKECTHLDLVKKVTASSNVCEECAALGDSYPDARVCMVCGYVGCCDGSKNKHMLKHFKETGHPIVMPDTSGGWMWCYVDEALLDPPKR